MIQPALSFVSGPMKPFRGFLAFSALILANGCSPAALVNALVPRGGYTVETAAYGSGPRRTLDVYRPEHTDGPAPVVVFFYGGNWQSGDKGTYLFVGQALADRGYVVVIPDYRLYPEVRFPAFLQDNAAAVRWTMDNIAARGGDPTRVYLMGHSAGAYDAAMLTLDRQWLGAVGIDPDRDIKGTIGLAGPYDFLPLTDPKLKAIFGPEDRLAQTQPINFVDGREPPMLLIAGTDDETVDPGNTTRLAARIRSQGGAVTEKHYPGVGHIKLVGALAAPLRFLAPTLDDVTAFLDRPSP